MESHTYSFTRKDLASAVGWPLAALAVISFACHIAAWLDLAPPPHPVLDVDRAVLVYKADLSRSGEFADVVLAGDSSCLMDIDASYLSELSGINAINLGTLSFLDLETFARLLAEQSSGGAKPPAAVVLLVHPEFLRRMSPSTAHIRFVNAYLNQEDFSYDKNQKLFDLLGLGIAEGRLLGRSPIPLTGDFARFYGFTHNLIDYMDEHAGSAIDPRKLSLAQSLWTSDRFRISNSHRRQVQSFLDSVPQDTLLIVGLTPTPSELLEPEAIPVLVQLLVQWGELLEADVILHDLPLTLPAAAFASEAHLTAIAGRDYTRSLAEQLRKVLPARSNPSP